MELDVKEKIKFKDIVLTLRDLPKTIRLVLKIEKKLFLVIIIISLITGIMPVVTLYISQELINSIVKIRTELNLVFQMFFIYIGLTFASELLSQVYGYFNSKFQFKVNYKLNYLVMEKSSKLSLKEFENPRVYDKLERVTKEISYKPYQIFQSVISLITTGVTLISSLLFLMAWNPKVTILLLLIPIISLAFFLKIGQQEFYIQWKRANKERKAWYLSHIMTHDFSFKEIKLYKIKDYILKTYWDIKKEFLEQDTYILRKKTIFNLIYEIVVQLVGAIVIIVAIFSAYAGRIMVGNVMSYIRAVGMVQDKSQSMMGGIYSIYNSTLYMNQLFEFLDYEEEYKESEEDKVKIDSIKSIELRNVSFRYPNCQYNSLENISFAIKAGERIAIVGRNGSGKSSLIKLLVGLYEVQEGDILINGISIKKIDRKNYMQQLSVLFQDFMKYELVLRENVGFGYVVDMDNDKKMISTLDQMQAGFLKQDNEYDLNAQLGLWFDEGKQLSGGQWQKVALARAYYKDASLLILDEPSAALDPIAEKETFDKFFKLPEDKIGVFISHRLIAAKLADRIIVMEQGEVVGEGTHEELIANCHLYREMEESESYELLKEESG